MDQDAADVPRRLSLCIEIDILDILIVAYAFHQLAHTQYHGRMGDIGRGFRGTVDQSIVLLGEEAFRNRNVEPDSNGDGKTQHAEHRGLMRDGTSQTTPVLIQSPVKPALCRDVKS